MSEDSAAGKLEAPTSEAGSARAHAFSVIADDVPCAAYLSDDQRAFLRALFPTDVGHFDLRALPSRAQSFPAVRDREGIATFLAQHATENVYVGMATRRTPENGTLANCLELWALFVDLDFKALPEAEARVRLGTFPLAPSLVVASGGGLHAYWLLKEPYALPDQSETAKALLRRLAQHFEGDLQSAECARVLRLPDSINLKYDPPRRVVLEHVDPERKYNPQEFEEWLAPDVPTNGAGRAVPLLVPTRIQAGARNATLYRAARSLHAKGFGDAAIHVALAAENAEKCDPPLSNEEVETIVAHALTQTDRPDFRAPLVPPAMHPPQGLDADALADATVVAAEGRLIAETGVPFVVEGMIPAYGMLGMLVAYAKVGKTSFALGLGAAVATGRPFLDRQTHQARVLIIAAEDPPEYTAWLARHLGDIPAGVLTFYRRTFLLNDAGLTQIATTVRAGSYGLVLIASWQAVVRSLIRDENDNAGAVRVVEHVKAFARQTGIPWLIDAHSGKGEDQTDDADPSRAMRGASGAAAAADYMLSLRYANGPFGTRRRLNGKGRFVSFAPLLLDFAVAQGTYNVIGTTKTGTTESTWRLISETGALTNVPQAADVIARAAGLVNAQGRATSTSRRQVRAALFNRDGVRITTETRRGQVTTLFALAGPRP